ncbi:MAG: SGNH/GDSL hydrolase family protein [Synergistaceae bacterium]|nr:SGNH/GDSL hydrolase family protein [Synergistaceae bacterium]
MKKFLVKLVIYVVILSSIALCINEMYRHQHNEADKFVEGVPSGIQICNFGSSHGGAFNYIDVKDKYVCFNFAMGGQSLPYDCRILENYKDNLQAGAIVFIIISDFSFFGVDDPETKDFASKNRRYYRFLRPELIQHYDAKTNFYVNYFPAIADGNIVSLFEHIYSFLCPPHENSQTTKFNHDKALSQVVGVYSRHIASHVAPSGQRIYKHDAHKAVYDMINMCRERNCRPILVTTPYARDYIDFVRENDPKFFADFYNAISEVVKNTGVEYYDYSHDERYTDDYAVFADNDHMNREGARLFTNTLLREVLGI